MTTSIKKIRSDLGLSRKDFAHLLGITYGAISNYEYGVRRPQLEICYRIIDIAKQHKLKVKLEDIYPRSD
jgi:putative transcriptional regulator